MASMVSLMVFELQAAQNPLNQLRPLYKPLRCSDGFVLVAPVNENNFSNICAATGNPAWQTDPLLSTAAARFHNWDYYLGVIEAWTLERSGEECERVLMGAGVPCTRYRSMHEVLTDDTLKLASVALFGTVEEGEFLSSALPFTLSGIQRTIGRKVPELGEDSNRILRTALNLTDASLAELSRNKVIPGGVRTPAPFSRPRLTGKRSLLWTRRAEPSRAMR